MLPTAIEFETITAGGSRILYALTHPTALGQGSTWINKSKGNCANRPFVLESYAMLRTLTFSLFFAGLTLAPVSAQEWAEKMFNKLEHGFGTVARGSDTVYKFEITNLYKQTMTISGVKSSCGCTTPSVENGTIKTHEKAYIVAKFNTHTKIGRQGATLTVTFARPYNARVQIRVHGNIRSDVVFSPGAISFSDVDEGEIREQTVKVNYAGRAQWSIVDVTNDNDHFEVELNELSRSTGRVSYGLLVRLKENVPAGYFKDQLTVVTNDQRAENQRIPIYVQGRILPEISVTPTTLVLGEVVAGEPITKKIVVRGKKPFRIVDVNCGNDCFSFKTEEESKVLHLVEITYLPRSNFGDVKVPVRITTDRANRGATIMVSATVTEPALPVETQVDTETQSDSSAETAKVADTASR
jgi:hypothetical protein